jgi:hypothetical protein
MTLTFHSRRMASADADGRRLKNLQPAKRQWSAPTLTDLVDTETLQIINDFISLYGAHTFGGLVGYGRCFGSFDRAEVQALVSARWLVRDERRHLHRFDGGPFDDE